MESAPVQVYKEKLVANGNNLTALLHFLWMEAPIIYWSNRYHVQWALFLLLAASRLGAIVESDNHRNSNQSLKYGKVKLLLERDPETKKVQLVLIVYFYKREYRRDNEETSFRARDLSSNPITWPILLLLALAFTILLITTVTGILSGLAEWGASRMYIRFSGFIAFSSSVVLQKFHTFSGTEEQKWISDEVCDPCFIPIVVLSLHNSIRTTRDSGHETHCS